MDPLRNAVIVKRPASSLPVMAGPNTDVRIVHAKNASVIMRSDGGNLSQLVILPNSTRLFEGRVQNVWDSAEENLLAVLVDEGSVVLFPLCDGD